jgi:bifunctional non-homologous end joining protein LigD
MRLPSPMLSRSGPIPTGDYAYELKFDGFRRSWDTTAFFEVRSRRGWNMTDRLPELGDLPAGCVFDGEIVRFEDGVPHFPLVCGRLLHADRRLPLAYLIFDLLAVDGEPITGRPYRERRVEGWSRIVAASVTDPASARG